MKAIITTTGKDKTGILAEITRYISDANCNVEDISQTIMQGNFVMIMMIDLSRSPLGFAEIKEGLDEIASRSKLSIHIQRAEIFEQMHHV